MTTIINFKDEINNYLKDKFSGGFEKQYCFDREDILEKWGDDSMYYQDTSIQYIINTEDIPEKGDIEYFTNYSGSDKINKIFNKYNLWFDWENECIVGVYKVDDYYDTDDNDDDDTNQDKEENE